MRVRGKRGSQIYGKMDGERKLVKSESCLAVIFFHSPPKIPPWQPRTQLRGFFQARPRLHIRQDKCSNSTDSTSFSSPTWRPGAISRISRLAIFPSRAARGNRYVCDICILESARPAFFCSRTRGTSNSETKKTTPTRHKITS